MDEDKLFEIVRNAYNGVNTDYLKSQVLAAVAEIGLTRQEVMEGLLDWIVVGGCTGMNDRYRPYIYGALALLREQEPRLMTLDEVLTAEDLVWAEIYTPNKWSWCVIYVKIIPIVSNDEIVIIEEDCETGWTKNKADYGKRGFLDGGWRCWTARPTEEQMRDTPWEGEKE